MTSDMSFFEKLFGKKGDSKDSHGSSKAKVQDTHRAELHAQYQQPFLEVSKQANANAEIEYSVYEAFFCDRLTSFSAESANDKHLLNTFCSALTIAALNESASSATRSPGHSTGGKHPQHSSHHQTDAQQTVHDVSAIKSFNLAQFSQVGEFVRTALQTSAVIYPVVRSFLAALHASESESDSALQSLLALCVTHPKVAQSHTRQLATTLTRTLTEAKLSSGDDPRVLTWLAESNVESNLLGDLLTRVYFSVFTCSWRSLLEQPATQASQAEAVEASLSNFDRLFAESALLHSRILSPQNRWMLATIVNDVYKLQGQAINRDESATSRGNTSIPGISGILLNRLTHIHKLYDSEEHGLSQNRFETKLNAYKAPMFIVVSFSTDGVAVIFLDEAFHNSLTRYGSFSTGVVTLQPKVERLMVGAGTFYFNTVARSGRRGLNVGISDSKVAFEIDFDRLVVNDFTKSNATGLQLGSIEVYGCGNEEARRKQGELQDLERKDVERARNRKLKPDDWESNTDREILELGGIKTRHSERGDI